MALPISGKISIKDIITEMGQSTRNNVNLNILAKEWFDVTGDLIFAKQEHELSDWYGKVWGIPIRLLNSFRISTESNPSDGFGQDKACSFIANRFLYHNGTGGDFSAPKEGDIVYTNQGVPFNGNGLSYKTDENKVIVINDDGKVRNVYNCRLVINELSIKPTRIDNVPLTGGQYTISVTSTGSWSARITSGASDSSISSASGNGNGIFRLRVNAETKLVSELKLISGTVEVTSGSKSVTLRWVRTGLILQ